MLAYLLIFKEKDHLQQMFGFVVLFSVIACAFQSSFDIRWFCVTEWAVHTPIHLFRNTEKDDPSQSSVHTAEVYCSFFPLTGQYLFFFQCVSVFILTSASNVLKNLFFLLNMKRNDDVTSHTKDVSETEWGRGIRALC